MRRSSRVSGSSLELLLDTICNTFGGVLFLAILIAVLVQLRERTVASQPPSRAQSAQMAIGHEQLAVVRDRLAALQAAEAQQQRVASEFSSDEVDHLLAEIARMETTKDQLAERKLRSLAEVADMQRIVNDTAVEREQLADEGKKLEKTKRKLEQELQKELEERTETARMPTLRATHKRERGFCLRYGKIYTLGVIIDRRGTGINLEDFEINRSGGQLLSVAPRIDGGVPLVVGPAAEALLKRKLLDVDPRQEFVAIWVWPDSIEEYRILKPIVQRMGFEFRLVPASEHLEAISIFFGEGGAKVQR